LAFDGWLGNGCGQATMLVAWLLMNAVIAVYGLAKYWITRRYLMELQYRPFSIEAHLDMWLWAQERLLAAPDGAPGSGRLP
jgi:hypothetical protein